MAYTSQFISLKEIVDQKEEAWTFSVPIYQRLFVWGSDEVKTLLDDLVNAYERGEELFFLGGTLVVEKRCRHGRDFELIDGQQRFTTLWMLCHVWCRALKPFLTVTESNQTLPRLRFAIRPTVNRYLHSLVNPGSRDEEEKSQETQSMRDAIATIETLFQRRQLPANAGSFEEYLTGLSQYIFEKVQMVLTIVPSDTDLNKLFEVINNRGVQLQHHEILKARMLDALSDVERQAYAILWDSCANMGEFAERGLAANSPLLAKDVAQLYDSDRANCDAEPLAKAAPVLDRLKANIKRQDTVEALGLDEILNRYESEAPGTDNDAEPHSDTPWIHSIISFPMLLQHALRIWLLHKNRPDLPRILDRDLLKLFENHFFDNTAKTEIAKNCRSFIEQLWELRYLFDKHFIKWVDRGEENIHMISPLSLSTSDNTPHLSRGRENEKQRGFGLLQSMLYHSQEITTHYWITPLLNFMHTQPGDATSYYEYLRHFETHLLGSTATDSLITRTRTFLEQLWPPYELSHREKLSHADGVRFRHYWFYKLEFILWYLYQGKDARWHNFRFTAKNSVEHISPQNPKETDQNRTHEMTDRFGNLALVSRNLNSEYSNLSFNEKKARFRDKNGAEVDSLKMDMIYQHPTWNDALAKEQKMQ